MSDLGLGAEWQRLGQLIDSTRVDLVHAHAGAGEIAARVQAHTEHLLAGSLDVARAQERVEFERGQRIPIGGHDHLVRRHYALAGEPRNWANAANAARRAVAPVTEALARSEGVHNAEIASLRNVAFMEEVAGGNRWAYGPVLTRTTRAADSWSAVIAEQVGLLARGVTALDGVVNRQKQADLSNGLEQVRGHLERVAVGVTLIGALDCHSAAEQRLMATMIRAQEVRLAPVVTAVR